MRWREIDREAAVWTVPAERIKAHKEHRVPLSPAALALLGEAGEPSALVFPGAGRNEAPLSDVGLAAVLRRMGRGELTVHGFRSTFRDWAGETTAHAREVIEAALAHRLKDKAEAAYARGDLFVRRRRADGGVGGVPDRDARRCGRAWPEDDAETGRQQRLIRARAVPGHLNERAPAACDRSGALAQREGVARMSTDETSRGIPPSEERTLWARGTALHARVMELCASLEEANARGDFRACSRAEAAAQRDPPKVGQPYRRAEVSAKIIQ